MVGVKEIVSMCSNTDKSLKKCFNTCIECGHKFKRRRKLSKLCSKKCQYINYKKTHSRARICPNCKIEFTRRKSDTAIFCGNKCYREYSVKENHPTWKGGIKREKDRRKSYECVQWRLAVFRRDDYTCQMCYCRGGYLEAHHIKSFSKHKELRSDIKNGITLCRSCHKKTDNYGAKSKTK